VATALAVGTALCLSLVSSPAAAEDQPLLNPLPDPTPSTLAIEVEEFAQLPESSPRQEPTDARLVRHNRINHIGEVPDGSGRLYVPDMNGTMYLLDEEDGSYVEYLDVRAEFADHIHDHAGLGTGFGFVEFHPEFAENGKFYTVHTEARGALEEHEPDFPAYGGTAFHSVITEWTTENPAAETFSGTSREIMRIPFAGRVHTVQQIEFNPTANPGDEDYGLLYLLVGDGGNGVGNGNPQDLATPHGKIFRIDPLGNDSANGQYGIPGSNPFVDTPGALGEIYAVGMRDPHRISWDPQGDHRMFLGHIGEWQVESIYEVRAGDNFGWSEREGPFLAKNRQIFPLPENDDDFGFTYPVAAYDHNRDPGQTGDAGVAVAGGYVYRGDIPLLKGRYLFADLVRGYVYSTIAGQMNRENGRLAPIEHLKVVADGEETTFQELVGDKRVDLRFGSDDEGDLYLVAKANGKIWKVTGAHKVRPGNAAPGRSTVLPGLADDVVARYTFDAPGSDPAVETDRGRSGTDITLVNGGAQMRVADEAYPGAGLALHTRQVDPANAGNDDWKAGIYDADGVGTLSAFNAAEQITVMGWFRTTGEHPAPNSNTANPDDRFNAIGLAGVLSGNSDGHGVRALLEVINVDGELKVVALGRRLDDGSSLTYAADAPWQEILTDEWVHLTATFDFTTGEMQLFMNGEKLPGRYTAGGDPWRVDGTGTSPTDPAGIKIGGSYPQDTREQNPCNCRMDDLMFLDTVPTDGQIKAQFNRYGRG